MHIYGYIYTRRGFLFYSLPNPFCPPGYPLLLPLVLPFTYLAPSSCDRNCPPSYQVACRLTLFAPPFTQSTQPLQIPRTPTAQRLTTTTLGLPRFHYAEQLLLANEILFPDFPSSGRQIERFAEQVFEVLCMGIIQLLSDLLKTMSSVYPTHSKRVSTHAGKFYFQYVCVHFPANSALSFTKFIHQRTCGK
jgi:hypothetical protein